MLTQKLKPKKRLQIHDLIHKICKFVRQTHSIRDDVYIEISKLCVNFFLQNHLFTQTHNNILLCLI